MLENQRVKINESEKFKNTWILLESWKKAAEHEGGGNINCSKCIWNSSHRLKKDTGWIENQWKGRNHPDCKDHLEYWMLES